MLLQEKIAKIGRYCNFHIATRLWIFVLFLTVFFLCSHIAKTYLEYVFLNRFLLPFFRKTKLALKLSNGDREVRDQIKTSRRFFCNFFEARPKYFMF